MKALVGLGNPGPEYERTRHNVGFLALDEAVKALGLGAPRRQFRGLLYEGRRGAERFVLMKPQTYMNLSGEAVRGLLQWYKLEPADVMVLSDDIDLPPGVMRIRAKGGAGTHNGWRSVIAETGSEEFPRARIGVGAPPPGWDLRDWVLSAWDKDPEAAGIREAVSLAAKAAQSFLEIGIQKTMNLYNLKSRPPKDGMPEKGEAPAEGGHAG